MSYESEIKKFQKMWDGLQDNQRGNDFAQDASFTKQEQIDLINNPPLKTKILREIGGPFKDIKVLQTTPYLVSGFEWKITETLPESWIPQIRIDIEYNYQGKLGDFTNVITYLNKVLSVQPAAGGLVTATWQVGFYLVSYNPTVLIPDFQAKLNFVLSSPSDAV